MLKVRICVAMHFTGSLYAEKQFKVALDAIVLRYCVKSVYVLSLLTGEPAPYFALCTPKLPADSAYLSIDGRKSGHHL